MPVPANHYDIPVWTRPAETKENLDYAPLTIIDLSIFDEPGGKQRLAEELAYSVKNVGFWTVVGTGISDEEVLRQFSIGNAFFSLPLEEKQKCPCDFSVGNYFGYRGPIRTIGNTGIKEGYELLCVPKYTANNDYADVPIQKHDFIKAHQQEIAEFQRKLFDNVVRKLFILLAIILELPENYLLDRHAYDEKSEDQTRFLMYHPRASMEERQKINNLELGGHTDFGTITLLFAQYVAGLQIRTEQGDWKFVKPVPGGITVNSADVLQFLTKGYIKSTIHRVIGPQPDQVHLKRLGLGYFVRPKDDMPIVTVPSPVLKREGMFTTEDEEANVHPERAVNGFEWTRARTANNYTKPIASGENDDEGRIMFRFKGLEVPKVWK